MEMKGLRNGLRKRKAFGTILSLLLVLVLVASGCTGGGSEVQSPTTDPNEPAQTDADKSTGIRDLGKIKFAYPDFSGGKADNKEENQIVLDAIKKKFLEDRNAKIDIEIVYIPGSQMETQLNMKLAANEGVDAFRLWWPLSMSGFATKSGLAHPVDDLLDQYGPNIKKKTAAGLWGTVTYNGKMWGVPQGGFDWQQGLIIRKDLLDKANLPIPKNLNELETAFAKFKEMGYVAYLGTKWYSEWNLIGNFGLPQGAQSITGSPAVDGANPIIDANGNIVPLITQPGFADYLQMLQKWIANGWLSKEFLTSSTAQVRDSTNTGKIAVSGAATAQDPADIFYVPNHGIDPNIEWALVPLFEGQKYATNSGVYGTITLVGSSKNAAAVMEYLDWLYADPKNYYLAYYGVEGVHYTADWNALTFTWLDKYKDPTAPKYMGVFAMDTLLERSVHPVLRETVDLSAADDVTKKIFDYRQKYIWNYMEKLQDDQKLKNPLMTTYMEIPSNLSSEITEKYKKYTIEIEKVIAEGKSIDDFKKLQGEMLQEWQEKYQQPIMEAYKRATGK